MSIEPQIVPPRTWNKGLLIGQKRPLLPKHVWSIRVRLEMSGSVRDLALFNLALDSKLRAAGLPAPVPAIETDVIPLKFALMRRSQYLSYHAAAHLTALDPGFITPMEVPGTCAALQAGLINRRGADLSPAEKALVRILQRRCSVFR